VWKYCLVPGKKEEKRQPGTCKACEAQATGKMLGG